MPTPPDAPVSPNADHPSGGGEALSIFAPYDPSTPPGRTADACPRCGTALGVPAPAADRDPNLINGKYQILGPLGSGGFGVVYKVKNLGLDRIEALKVVLKHRFASAEVEDRFQREVKANARLQHEGIVLIYDTGKSEDGPFFTMEYAERGTLKNRIDQHFTPAGPPKTLTTVGITTAPQVSPNDSPGSVFDPPYSSGEIGDAPSPPPPPAAGVVGLPPPPPAPSPVRPGWGDFARLMVLIAEAVECMHGENVCHRDLKPTNILIDDAGRPKLTDFGLATLVAGRADDPSAGTPNYMAPEQAAEWLAGAGRDSARPGTPEEPPDRRDFYRRGDIYGLGAVFYEMLTGNPPVPSQAHPEATLRAVVEGNIVPPRQANPAVPPKLEAICLRCLHFDPARRYGGAAEVAAELHEYLRPRTWTLAVLGGVILLLAVALAAAVVTPRIDRYLEVRKHFAVSREKEAAAHELEKDWGNEAKDQLRQALLVVAHDEFRQALQKSASGDPAQHVQLARITLELGKAEEDLRNVPEARRRYKAAEEQLTSPLVADSDLAGPVLAEVYHREATLLRDAEKKFDEAEKHYLKSRALLKQLHEADPANRVHQRNLARSYGYLGDIEVEKGEMREARHSYDEAKRLRQGLVDFPNPDETDRYQRARGLGNDGTYYEWEGKFGEAVAIYLDQLVQLKACPKPIPREFQWDTPALLVQMAELRLLTRTEVDPAKLLESLAEAKKDWDADVGLKPRILLALGRCNALMSRKAEAASNLHEAIDAYVKLVHESKAQPEDYYRLSQAHAALSRVSDDAGRAEYHQVAAVLRLEEAAGRGFRHWQRVEADRVYGDAIRASKEFREAIRAMKAKRR